jgi:uncharacterized membrane protein YphA (DoxX/SURF4 family)
MDDKTFRSIFLPLRWTYGLVPVLAGLDKFTNLLADWPSYMSPLAAGLLPVGVGAAMKLIGVVELAVGLLILGGWTRLGAYVAAAWLTLIALNLVALGTLDVAVRDLVMAVGAYTLARLAEARERRLL